MRGTPGASRNNRLVAKAASRDLQLSHQRRPIHVHAANLPAGAQPARNLPPQSSGSARQPAQTVRSFGSANDAVPVATAEHATLPQMPTDACDFVSTSGLRLSVGKCACTFHGRIRLLVDKPTAQKWLRDHGDEPAEFGSSHVVIVQLRKPVGPRAGRFVRNETVCPATVGRAVQRR